MGRVLIAAMLAAGLSAAACAQDYPSRPVTMVVPFTSGGSTEIMARLIAQGLETKLGKPVIVENKPGAGTVIGSNFVAKSEPDGYTLLMGTSSPIAINVTVYKALPYNPATDFVPLAMVAESPFVLVVNNDLPVKTVPELIAYAKANPGKLSFGSGGPGAPHHLFAELFASMAGIKMTHVPYRGSLPALNDVLAGHIQLMFVDLPPAVGMISSGKIRALGVTPAKRLAALPDVPTIAEAGVPGYSAAAWFMVVAPAKTPKPVADRLHADLKEVLSSAQTREQIDKLGLTPLDTPPIATMQDFVKSEIARWGKVVEAAGIAGSQ
ncbi:Bug family tripartite tricarboxylate transporter substrate binding protein [Rhodoplanes sp. Z2-YC6860]|uniref:Bug family tripartite tricarboxylate transporter substrate binding protein n=1 Tax=Rhodoplanes sp. Z2-YC6860 TaxID=674703 RepID=UPI0018DC9462|nr:tripartite tricarboxylate transporter substrate binding protein [Rhodoplanes sp. Z2-YC6860]